MISSGEEFGLTLGAEVVTKVSKYFGPRWLAKKEELFVPAGRKGVILGMGDLPDWEVVGWEREFAVGIYGAPEVFPYFAREIESTGHQGAEWL